MKKVLKAFVVIAAVLLFSSAISSCKTTQDCSAYGEVKKYQREVRH